MNFDLENLSSFSGWERLAETGMAFGTNLVAALAIFLIGKWIASRLVILMKAALTRAKVDRTLVSFLGNVANIGLLILIIIAALGKLGIPTTSVTALIGGAGLAVALSLKDQLSNFAAGALIILFRPFKVGDFIKVNGFEGTVSEIKMVQTALSTPDNEEVILPNSIVMSNCIVNRSSMPLCRVRFGRVPLRAERAGSGKPAHCKYQYPLPAARCAYHPAAGVRVSCRLLSDLRIRPTETACIP